MTRGWQWLIRGKPGNIFLTTTHYATEQEVEEDYPPEKYTIIEPCEHTVRDFDFVDAWKLVYGDTERIKKVRVEADEIDNDTIFATFAEAKQELVDAKLEVVDDLRQELKEELLELREYQLLTEVDCDRNFRR